MTTNKKVTASDGINLHVEVTGNANLPKLILSNSLGTTTLMWKQQVAALSNKFCIACYDTRGHGQSDAPEGDYNIDQLGQDVLSIADALGWETFNFSGVSLGGMTGFWLAINAPERLQKVMPANGGPMAGGPDAWTGRIAMVKESGLAQIAESAASRWFTEDFIAKNPEIVNAIVEDLKTISPVGYVGCCTALRDIDLRAGLESINVPMLVITGDQDQTPPPAMLKMAADKVPNSQFLVLPAAHLSNIGASEAFNKALIEFML